MVGERGFLNLARGSRPSNPSQRHFPLQLPLNYRYKGCRAERDYCRNPTPAGRKRRDLVPRNRRDRASSPRSGEKENLPRINTDRGSGKPTPTAETRRTAKARRSADREDLLTLL